MRPVSPGFLAAVAGSHTMAARLRAVPSGQTGVTPAGGLALYLTSGDVQLDATADIRSTIDCTVAAVDPESGARLWPAESDAPLTPYGVRELFVERGVAFGGGLVEYVPLGYFRIDDVQQSDAPDGPIALSGSDRMSMIIDSKLTTPLQFAATTTYGALVTSLAEDAYPGVTIEWDDFDIETDAIGRSITVEDDRYASLREAVLSVGKVAYFDHRGILVIRTPPAESTPLWTVSRGEGGVLVTASRSLSREGVYNGVLATGEALDTEPPVRGLAVDNDPTSPTYWGGPFGRIPREYASPLLTTNAQCVLAAKSILRRTLGLPYNLDLSAVPNPALEPDDPIAVGLEGVPRMIEPALISGDSFSRTVVNGMGTSESGHLWSTSGGAENQVAAGVYTKNFATANLAATVTLPVTLGRRDVDIVVDVQAPAIATVAALPFGIVTRYSGSATLLTSRLEFNPGGTLTLKHAVHNDAGFGYYEPVQLVGFATYTAGQWWTVRARTHGDQMEIKAWPRSEAEPDEWMLTCDNANDLTSPVANRFGLFFWRVTGNTNTGPQWQVDNFRAYSVPGELLQGGEIHVIQSLSIPLVASGAMRATTREQTLVTIDSI